MTQSPVPLLGQLPDAFSVPMPSPGEVIGMGLAVGMFTLVGWIVHRLVRKSELAREMEHLERLRSIEAGLPWPGSDPGTDVNGADKRQQSQMHNAFWIAFWLVVVGVAGPFHAVSALFDAESGRSAQLAVAALGAAGAASVTASICAVVVVLCSRPKSEGPHESSSTSSQNA